MFTQIRFSDLGSDRAIGRALQRHCDDGTIRRLARGIYDYPQVHPTLGPIDPAPETIARAMAGPDRQRIQPAGAYAANQLGLSQRKPAKRGNVASTGS